MNLYEINKAIEDLINTSVDPETGEISEGASAALDSLIVEKNDKILNTAKYIKNKSAFVDAMKAEMKVLGERVSRESKRIEWLEGYAKNYMAHGEKYEDSQVSVSLRRSTRVEITNLDLIPALYKKETLSVSADKKLIGDAIKDGFIVEGAKVVEAFSVQIK